MDIQNTSNYFKSGSKAVEVLRSHMRTIINLKLLQLLLQNDHLGGFEKKVDSLQKNVPISQNNNQLAKVLKQESSSEVKQVEQLEIFDCEICFDSYPLRQSITFGCDHRFCIDCISDYLSTQISEGIVETFNCPRPECVAKASETLIEQLVPLPIYERYLKLQIQNSVSSMEDIFYCPNPECQAIVECEIDVGIGSCFKCGQTFCTSCLKEFHGTSDCNLNEHERREMLLRYQIQKKAEDEEIARQLRIAEEKRKALEEEKQKRVEQDRASESFIRRAFKKCPGCQSDVEKLSGCNRMYCTKCRNNFCWLCLRLLTGDPYKHFGDKCQVYT